MTRIAHISDVHFGRIRKNEIVDALLHDVHESKPDLVAISGDLTQRAYSWQYRDAREFVEAFEQPVLVVPGNHDVWPMWWPLRRLKTPVSRYEEVINRDLAPMVKTPGAWVLGLNSAHGKTVKGGRVTSAQAERLREAFKGGPEVRVLVIHHPVAPMPHASKADVCVGGSDLLESARASRVQVVLSGHLHVAQNVRSAEGPILIHAGTATSTRGRGPDKEANTYNIVELDGQSVVVERRDFDGQAFRLVRRETLAVSPERLKPGIGLGM
ncbi:MAG: 3',5'-cyclic AMP phosphodiesterase CpdA [Rhodothermales bacterium]